MTITALVVGGLAVLAGLAILLPGRGVRRTFSVGDPDEDLRRELLHQLRDLDDDLSAGKLADDDHQRLRGPVERELAEVLARIEKRRARGGTPKGSPAQSRTRSRRRVVVSAVLVGAGAVTAVAVVLAGSLAPRAPGAVISGGAPGSSADGAAAAQAPTGQSADGQPGAPALTAEQVAAVNAAVSRVKDTPDDVAAHLDLARAYAGAGQNQLSTIEYLAVIRLEPTNAEANVALALVAFVAGQAQQAKDMVDTVLAAHPDHPEALYARGLIQLMGLKQPEPAKLDLQAYLRVAPYGSHREAAQTLLTMTTEKPAQ